MQCTITGNWEKQKNKKKQKSFRNLEEKRQRETMQAACETKHSQTDRLNLQLEKRSQRALRGSDYL